MVVKKRVLALFLSILLVIINMLNVFAASVLDFSDMPQQDHWSRKALEAAVENELLQGSGGKLNPQGKLTRAEMATIINRAFGAVEEADISSFTDVPANAWFYPEMAKAVAMGTFEGDNHKLRPNDPITRQEAFVVLARALRLSGGSTSALNKFSDKGKIADWASGEVAALAEAGYIEGSDGKLSPTDYITREQFAQVMFNTIPGYISGEGTYTEDITGNVMVKAPGVIFKDMTINGDLIIGEGLADGGLTLENVKVTGRIVIRGGGSTDGIKIDGTSSAAEVVVFDKNGVALNISESSDVKKVSVYTDNAVLNIPATTLVIAKDVEGTILNGEPVTGGQTIAVNAESGTGNAGTTPGGGNTGGAFPGGGIPGGNTGGGNQGGGNTGGGDTGGGNEPTRIATESISLSPAAINAVLGSYNIITAVRTPANANDTIEWSSSNESVARVDATGKVGAVGAGTAVISATAENGFVASVTVYVTAPASGSSFTISVPGTVVPAGSVYNEVTIAEGVGENEVSLTGVILNRLITRGGGSNSIMLSGVSILSITIEETPPEGTRILLSGSATVGTINITNANANAIVETEIGSGSSVGSIISAGPLTVRNLSVSTIEASSNIKLEGAAIGEITTNGESIITLDSNSSIDKIIANEQTTVEPATGATVNKIDKIGQFQHLR